MDRELEKLSAVVMEAGCDERVHQEDWEKDEAIDYFVDTYALMVSIIIQPEKWRAGLDYDGEGEVENVKSIPRNVRRKMRERAHKKILEGLTDHFEKLREENED